MTQLKQKTILGGVGEAIANGISAAVEVAGDCYDTAKGIMHDMDYEIRVLKVTNIAAKVALKGDLTCVTGLYKIMFPISAKGMRINYGDPCSEKCPTHGCHAFRTYENPKVAWCPLCMRFLQLN